MPNPGDEFEEHVQLVYETLLNQVEEGTRVSRGLAVKDTRGRIFNIDVHYEFIRAGIAHRVAIECKDTKRPISRDDAIAFKGKLDELPSTVGVFISRRGYQRGAAEYLDDHGILRLSEKDLPTLPQLVAGSLVNILLPDEHAVGQPFWTLMQTNDLGQNTGNYYQVAYADHAICLPFYFARKHATRAIETLKQSGQAGYVVRGLTQRSLRALLVMADFDQKGIALMSLGPNNDGTWSAPVLTAREISTDYVLEDMSDIWRERDSRSRR